ncbi:MAG: DUF362 domain-containing protein [Armatimonadota bacterium]|nr:MAG: DUF362 domain-containing protein [Armatimonadota bacterium]
MSDRIGRREFLRTVAGVGAAALIGGCGARGRGGAGTSGAFEPRLPKHVMEAEPVLAIASGGSIEDRVRAAVAEVGGMARFVKQGDTVVIKPNAAWQRSPQQAATTNPEVVVALINLCQEQAAGKVVVIEHMIDMPPRLVWDVTGLGEAIRAAGSEAVSAHDQRRYATLSIPKGKVLTSDSVIRDILEADVFINAPIAKVHGASVITAAMKNMMGVVWNRQYWHQADLQQCIADFSTALRPDLMILDANRILLTSGPKGPGDTKDVGEVVAGFDPVAVDAYAATLLGIAPQDVPHVDLAHQAGVGEMDLSQVQMKHVKA